MGVYSDIFISGGVTTLDENVVDVVCLWMCQLGSFKQVKEEVKFLHDELLESQLHI